MKKELNLLVEKIRGANSIVIVGHKNPDGDCVCATLALARLIELNFGKVPVCMYDGNFPNILQCSEPYQYAILWACRCDASV